MWNAKITVRERLNFQVQQLEQKDPRFRVEPRITAKTEEYIFLAQESVQGTLSVGSNNTSALTKFEDLLDKGRRVDFEPGELTFTGSPLFEEFAERGGGLRVSHSFAGLVTLISLTGTGEAVSKWEGLTGVYEGGQKEVRFKSNLGNSPLIVELRLVPQGVDANLVPKLEVWINQRLLAASYFEKTCEFYKGIASHPRLRIEGYKDGNRFFGSTATLGDRERFCPILRFLEIMQKARRVARHFNLDPFCTLDNLGAESLRNIEMTHDILFNDFGYWNEHPAIDVTITISKSEAQRFAIEQDRELHDLIMYGNYDEDCEFMGFPIKMGSLVTSLTNAKMLWSKEEFRERIDQARDDLQVCFGSSEKSRYSIRKATTEEM